VTWELTDGTPTYPDPHQLPRALGHASVTTHPQAAAGLDDLIDHRAQLQPHPAHRFEPAMGRCPVRAGRHRRRSLRSHKARVEPDPVPPAAPIAVDAPAAAAATKVIGAVEGNHTFAEIAAISEDAMATPRSPRRAPG
jgi:hypothetical protein